jgi:hypothetical protein
MITFLPCKFQLHCLEKSGRQITKMVSYCAYHRYKILTSVISLFSFPVFSLTCSFIQHLVQWGQCLGLDYPDILLYKQLFFCCLQLLPLSLWFHLICRAPNPDTVLIVQTPVGVFSAKSLLQNKKKAGSRLISSNRAKIEEIPTEETTELEPFSAARCRIFKRLNNNKKVL